MGHFTKNHHQFNILHPWGGGGVGDGGSIRKRLLLRAGKCSDPVSRKQNIFGHTETWRHGTSWNVYCYFKSCHRTACGSFFQVVLRGRVVFMGVCQMPIKTQPCSLCVIGHLAKRWFPSSNIIHSFVFPYFSKLHLAPDRGLENMS